MANRNGRKGSKQHQEVQDAEFEKMDLEYGEKDEIMVKKEARIPTPTSEVEERIADVVAYSWLKRTFRMKFHKIVQVGKTNKDGTPVAREQKAIEDIEKHTGIKVIFVDYENYNLDD